MPSIDGVVVPCHLNVKFKPNEETSRYAEVSATAVASTVEALINHYIHARFPAYDVTAEVHLLGSCLRCRGDVKSTDLIDQDTLVRAGILKALYPDGASLAYKDMLAVLQAIDKLLCLVKREKVVDGK